MKRTALRDFFRHAALVLPLATAGCPTYVCNTPNGSPTIVVAVDGGLPDALGQTECQNLCDVPGLNVSSCAPGGLVDGGQELTCNGRYMCTGGRRPTGLAEQEIAGGTGGWLAAQSHLEAASVHAFRHLADELRAFGAPEDLIDRAEASARDEIRHARVTSRLARRFGARPLRPRFAPPSPRSLFALAEENVVEGCVRETFGALTAGFQARNAADEKIRRAFAAIARDEERHAELAWSIDSWARRRLDRAAREKLDEARRRAAAELPLDGFSSPELGLPSKDQARALHAYAQSLWA